MTMTESNMRTKATELNELYFRGTLILNKVEFQISRKMSRSLGNLYHYHNGRIVIKLSHHTILHYGQSVETLCHELIHLEQVQRRIELGHGTFFKLRCRQINEVSSMRLSTRCDHVPEIVMDSIFGRRGAVLPNPNTPSIKPEPTLTFTPSSAVIVIRNVTIPGHAVAVELSSNYKKTMTKLRATLRKISPDYTNTCMIVVNGTAQNYSHATTAIKSLF